ncbi:MAG: tetratricopeptide repeat protein [Rhodospirillales bacterium]|jgi:predicted O-linked N-acetylglucosamine transferase (SPINDLY family)
MKAPKLAQAFQLYGQGRLDDAKTHAAQYLDANPNDAEAQYLLGGIAFAQGHNQEAGRLFRAVLEGGFTSAELLFNLAEVSSALEKSSDAQAFYEQALALDPKLAAAHQRLGLLASRQGRFEDAVGHLQQAFFLTPDAATANNLGAVLQHAERLGEAEVWYRQSLTIDPHHAKAIDNLGGLMQLAGRLSDAVECHENAIAIDPKLAPARVNLANAFMAEGRIPAALAALRWAQVMEKTARTASQNYLMCLNYDEATDGDALYREHRRFGDYQEKRISPVPLPARPKDLPKPLRLGFVSADFRRHSVAYFLEPLLESLDPALVQIYLYADVANPDEVSERLKSHAQAWRDLRGLSDEAAASLVREDGIHLLIDLAGHTAGNRLGLFVLKPAHVQATWLGYPATTGLSRIDWRLTDAIADPLDGNHAEGLMRLSRFLCYRPDDSAPKPAEPPVLQNGFVTFGSFNALAKLGERDLTLMARILNRVPEARLMLKARPLADDGVKKRLFVRLGHHGIDPGRVDLVGRTPDAGGHLAHYAKIDIALDPVHYNGTATTCEALWMGVPVVTLQGNRHASRVGASLLTSANLPQTIAEDEAAYVAIAVKLAADPMALAENRAKQRAILKSSPLLDKAAFAKDFMRALADMWPKPLPVRK